MRRFDRSSLFRASFAGITCLVCLTNDIASDVTHAQGALQAVPSADGTRPEARVRMEVAVDGSRNPELIPEVAAIRLLMLNLAQFDAAQYRGGRSRAELLRLSESDLWALREELTELRDTMNRLDDEGKSSSGWTSQGDALAQSRQRNQELSTAAIESYHRARRRLSADGVSKLQIAVDRQKRSMRILKPPPG